MAMLLAIIFKYIKIISAQLSKSNSKIAASFMLMLPLASGLFLVLSTFLSISMSIMSLIMQPALRITMLPTINNTRSFILPASFARAIPHKHGHRSRNMPVGWCNLISLRYSDNFIYLSTILSFKYLIILIETNKTI